MKFYKKGMEMWELVIIILAILFLVVILFWYSGLGTEIKSLLSKFGDW